MISQARQRRIHRTRKLLAPSDVTLFFLTFSLALFCGILLQTIIIPFALPQIHSGDGLAGGDWSYFHSLALQQADAIVREGWGAWLLRPEGQAPAGIASIFYVLIYPKPITILPLNAALFATSVVTVRSILAHLFADRAVATLGALPFLLFPTFAIVWGQLHKDVFVGAGFLLVFEALLSAKIGRRSLALVSIQTTLGAALVWIARGYALEIICISCILFLSISGFKHRENLTRTVVVVSIVVLCAMLGHRSGLTTKWIDPTHSASQNDTSAHEKVADVANDCDPTPSTAFDSLMYSICEFRSKFLHEYSDAGSNLSQEPKLRHINDYIWYLPRALQISLTEPSPFSLSPSKSPIGSIGRGITRIEMTICYGAFIFGALFGWRHLLNPTVIGCFGFLLTYIMIYAFACPNLGTLYRERLFAHTMIVSIMIAAATADFWKAPTAVREADSCRS